MQNATILFCQDAFYIWRIGDIFKTEFSEIEEQNTKSPEEKLT